MAQGFRSCNDKSKAPVSSFLTEDSMFEPNIRSKCSGLYFRDMEANVRGDMAVEVITSKEVFVKAGLPPENLILPHSRFFFAKMPSSTDIWTYSKAPPFAYCLIPLMVTAVTKKI